MEAHVIAEVEPFVPVRDGRAGATRTDSLGDCFLSKAERSLRKLSRTEGSTLESHDSEEKGDDTVSKSQQRKGQNIEIGHRRGDWMGPRDNQNEGRIGENVDVTQKAVRETPLLIP